MLATNIVLGATRPRLRSNTDHGYGKPVAVAAHEAGKLVRLVGPAGAEEHHSEREDSD